MKIHAELCHVISGPPVARAVTLHAENDDDCQFLTGIVRMSQVGCKVSIIDVDGYTLEHKCAPTTDVRRPCN